MASWKDIKGIYLIERININEKNDNPIYYIGQSVGIFNRWRQHCNRNEQNIDKAIKHFGYINFSFSILEIVKRNGDLNERETYWINEFKKKDETKMFNISQTTNKNPYLIDTSVKNEIVRLFEKEIGQSIYAISEKYKIEYIEVINIRKDLLKKQGLKYNRKSKNINDRTGKVPKNWKGDRVTQRLGNKIIMLKNQDLDIKDIAYECHISIVDLKKFINEYDDNIKNYNFADSIE